MCSEGPVISMQPVSAISGSPPHIGSPMNKHLTSISRRERSSSASDVSSPTQHLLPPSPLADPIRQSLDIQRSLSMPRGVRGTSPGPNPSKSLPTSKSTDFRDALSQSHRMIRRAETVETSHFNIEDFEDYTQVNQYKVLDIIGHGSYGIVRKATDDNELFALKIVGKRRLRRKSFPVRPRQGVGPRAMSVDKTRAMSLSPASHPRAMSLNSPGIGPRGMSFNSPLDNIGREIAILKKLDHPNVVKLIEVLDDPNEDELILVFEYIPNGPPVSHLPTEDTLTEDKAREYFIDLILGLEYLHSKHVIHRDIKPENLLLDHNDRVKIADFGVSEEIMTSDAHLTRSAGTPAFIAPECLEVSKKTYRGQAVDIWAAGVTLYCFIYGRPPWSSKFITELHEKIQTEDLPLPDNVQISPELRDLLTRLTEKDAEKRITISQIREHPWILQSDRVLPSKEDNCRGEISVSEEDIKKAFKPFNTPIHILVMIKQMAKKRSLTNPYSPKPSPRSSPKSSPSHESSTVHVKRETFAKSHGAPSISVESYDTNN